ncbi:MAG: hypothetical protein JWP89_1317 [Schlesneria sp.]|nr:hypothetical protein [Schlesneria sp.]
MTVPVRIEIRLPRKSTGDLSGTQSLRAISVRCQNKNRRE